MSTFLDKYKVFFEKPQKGADNVFENHEKGANNSENNLINGASYTIAKEHKLFYWRGKASAKLEFIVESDNKLYPIDVKKGRGTLNSLEKFSNHNKFELAIKVSKSNYGYNPEQKLLTVPFYFFPFLAQELAEGKPII